MKKNLYYFSLMLGLVLEMTMFTACGGDDDDSGNSNGQTSGGGSATEDYGTDGLKGYWVQNVWNETILEEWTYYGSYTGSKNANTYGQYSDLIYLDGDGGGTICFGVTTLDHAANNAKYLTDKVGTFLDPADGKTRDYHFRKEYTHERSGPSIYFTDTDREYKLGKSYPMEYYIKGTTMTIYYNNVTQSMQLNVSSGNINGYHRLKKVD